MSVTLAQLLTLTQSYLNDTEKGTYTDALLTPLLNTQQNDLAREVTSRMREYFEVYQTINFVSGTQEYTLNPIPYRIRYVEIYESGSTEPAYVISNFEGSGRKWAMGSAVSLPSSVYLSGNKIGFVPIPAGGSAKVMGIVLPADMTPQISMGLPDVCKDVLVLRTAILAKAGIMDEDAGGLAAFLTKAEARLLEELGTRTESEQRVEDTNCMYYGEA